MITIEQLEALAPHATDQENTVNAINSVCEKFDINTDRRVRYFMTQTSFESAGFTHFEENLHYSHAEQLVRVWPSHFSMTGDDGKALASDYVGNPEKLGNFIYANRNGNGDVDSGDGWAFRGRGPIELTGRSNYEACSQAVYGDDRLVTNPDLVAECEAGFMSSGWFWSEHGLNALSDDDEFTKVTKAINGSAVTVPERLVVLDKANSIF